MSQSTCIAKVVHKRTRITPILKSILVMIRPTTAGNDESPEVKSAQRYIHRKARKPTMIFKPMISMIFKLANVNSSSP
jgi:hypothetical protein